MLDGARRDLLGRLTHLRDDFFGFLDHCSLQLGSLSDVFDVGAELGDGLRRAVVRLLALTGVLLHLAGGLAHDLDSLEYVLRAFGLLGGVADDLGRDEPHALDGHRNLPVAVDQSTEGASKLLDKSVESFGHSGGFIVSAHIYLAGKVEVGGNAQHGAGDFHDRARD